MFNYACPPDIIKINIYYYNINVIININNFTDVRRNYQTHPPHLPFKLSTYAIPIGEIYFKNISKQIILFYTGTIIVNIFYTNRIIIVLLKNNHDCTVYCSTLPILRLNISYTIN